MWIDFTGKRRELIVRTENEKLPSELGWTKQAEVVQLADTARIAAIINNATSLITPIAPIAPAAKRRDLHSVW